MQEPDQETSGLDRVDNRDPMILGIQNKGFLNQLPTLEEYSEVSRNQSPLGPTNFEKSWTY